MSLMLTPQKAAHRAKCGRSSIMRALSSGELKGTRDNAQRWRIPAEAVDDWMTMRPDDRQRPVITKDKADHDRTAADTPETLIRLAVAEARLSDVTAERDKLAELLKIALESRPVSLIAWLFGRQR